jgi:hypothetical protein
VPVRGVVTSAAFQPLYGLDVVVPLHEIATALSECVAQRDTSVSCCACIPAPPLCCAAAAAAAAVSCCAGRASPALSWALAGPINGFPSRVFVCNFVPSNTCELAYSEPPQY